MWAQQIIGPGRFERVEVPAPTADDLAEGQVLVRVLSGGICGSDLPMYLGRPSRRPGDNGKTGPEIPGVPMHEVVGEILESRVDGLHVGERVVGWAMHPGSLAEYTICSADEIARYPEQFSPEIAIGLQPLACALYVIAQLNVEGKRTAVIGLGSIGLLFAHALKSAGAAHVTGVDRIDRSGVVKNYGVDEFVHASSDRWCKHVAPEEQFDVVIEAVGHQQGTLHDAIQVTKFGGHIYAFGLPDEEFHTFPALAFFRKNLTLTSGVTTDRVEWLTTAGEYLIEHPELEKYVTSIYHFDETEAAYHQAFGTDPARVKVALTVGE